MWPIEKVTHLTHWLIVCSAAMTGSISDERAFYSYTELTDFFHWRKRLFTDDVISNDVSYDASLSLLLIFIHDYRLLLPLLLLLPMFVRKLFVQRLLCSHMMLAIRTQHKKLIRCRDSATREPLDACRRNAKLYIFYTSLVFLILEFKITDYCVIL